MMSQLTLAAVVVVVVLLVADGVALGEADGLAVAPSATWLRS
jgi:hypothetical protein